MRLLSEEPSRQDADLRTSVEMFQLMSKNILEIFWMMNAGTKELTYVSPAFEHICEVPLDSIHSNPTFYCELIHPEDRQRMSKALENLADTNKFEEEFRIVCPSGTVKWLRGIGCQAKDSHGEVQFVGTAQEITSRKEEEIALRESEDLFRDMVEHSSDLICAHTLEGRLISVNEMPARLLGYTREEVLAKPMREFLLPEARAQFDESLKDIQRTGIVTGLMVVLSKTGERRIWEYRNTLRTDVSVPIVRGIAHDVTDQKRTERALQLSEEKFSKAFLACPYAIVISTIEEGKFIEVNDSFLRIMGFTREESVGRTSIELDLWTSLRDRDEILNEITNRGRVSSKQIIFRAKGGNQLVVNYTGEVIELRGRKHLLSMCEDITGRVRTEQELRRLSGHLLKLQDEERRKIARDLHDSTGQDLAALATNLSKLHDEIPASNRKSRKLLSESQAVANRCLNEVRTLSYLLHPPMLDEAGLADAVSYFAKGFGTRTGIALEIEVSPDFGRLSPDMELGLFRIVQESLTNIQRHSGSGRAKIELNREKEKITLRVSDAGRGIALDKREQSRPTRQTFGVGIASMQERVKQLGGQIEIQTSDLGTSVFVTVPIYG